MLGTIIPLEGKALLETIPGDADLQEGQQQIGGPVASPMKTLRYNVHSFTALAAKTPQGLQIFRGFIC